MNAFCVDLKIVGLYDCTYVALAHQRVRALHTGKEALLDILQYIYIFIFMYIYIFLYVHNYQYSNIVIHLVCESRFIHAALAFAAMHDLVLQALGQDGRSSRATL